LSEFDEQDCWLQQGGGYSMYNKIKKKNVAHIGEYINFINNSHTLEELKLNILLHISSVTKEALQRVTSQLKKRVHALLMEENVTNT